MARPRTGSIYFNPRRDRWMGAVSLGGGKRRTVSGLTEAEVRSKLAAAGETVGPHGAHPSIFRAQKAAVAGSILARAEQMGWDRNMTAKVLSFSMTRARIKAGVSGPCAYCGDEFADTVDHVIPFARGGRDEPGNVVSACLRCNARKGRREALSA